MKSKEIMRMRYRIGSLRSEEIIATKKICEEKKKILLEKHNGNIKFSKIVSAADHPFGAPNV